MIQPIDENDDYDIFSNFKRSTQYQQRRVNSEIGDDHSFEVIDKSPYNFTNIGGYDKIKTESEQVVDILINRERCIVSLM